LRRVGVQGRKSCEQEELRGGKLKGGRDEERKS
jgi:hypothetical protein